MAGSRRTRFVVGVAALLVTAVVTTLAQGLGPSSSGSLRELTAEVRELRLALQAAGREQTQMQAVSIALTAQHSRLMQVSARLDTSEKDLAAAVAQTQAALKLVADAQNEARTATPVGREHWEAVAKLRKAEADAAQEAENRVRTRQLDLMSAFRTEEARWLDLVARLEEIVKR